MVTGLRERKKQRTRDAIEIAAVELVEELGLGQVTIELIAERAEVTSRTVFNHFAGKEEAVLGIPRADGEVIWPGDRELLRDSMFATAVEFVRHALVDFTTDTLRLDARRREITRMHPTLLTRQLERFAVWEEALGTQIALLWPDVTGTDVDVLRDRARAATLLVGVALRLGIEDWARSDSEPERLVDHFDRGVQRLVLATAEASGRG